MTFRLPALDQEVRTSPHFRKCGVVQSRVAFRRNAISALFSGPAAGVTGAIRQAGASDYTNLVTFDMGGTSTDVCLVTDSWDRIDGVWR